MSAWLPEQSSYRPEIQGIRTIGALLVAVFHIWGGRVSGGVDVFFVISGFLITGSLYRELQRRQSIDVIAFWGRIAKRIAPLAYSVLGLTLLVALLLMPLVRRESFLSEVFYSAFHLENIKLMMNSVDYLARDEPPSPVQQFWALSVQVQFYAIWPFLLMAAALLARKLCSVTFAFVAVLAAVFLASLAYSIIQTGHSPAPTYFDTWARVWEFALGGLVAVVLPHLTIAPVVRFLAGWTGLLAVVSCGFMFSAKVTFPGYVALWPTIGAALVLVSGGGSMSLGADRVLAWKPLVALGEISFSFYLWHWPVLIFYMIAVDRTKLGIIDGLLVIALALYGAYLLNRWVEQPIQRSAIGKYNAWHLHAMGTGWVMPILVTTTLWTLMLERADSSRGLAKVDYPGGSIPASMETAVTPGIPLRPGPASAKGDLPRPTIEKCQQRPGVAELIVCTYGNETAPTKTIVLAGGSHSAQWFPALEVLAHQNGWRIINIPKAACTLSYTGRPTTSSDCETWRESALEYLTNLKPDVVFTTSTRPYRGAQVEGQKPRREHVPSAYVMFWSRLEELRITVIAVRDNPWPGHVVPECVEKNLSNVVACARPRDRHMNDVDPSTSLEPKPKNVEFIDLTDRFCDQTLCHAVGGNILIYRDRHHMTATFARSLAPVLGERMKEVRPDLFANASSSFPLAPTQ
ncbi:acyltransferase family protein [Microvirga aerophila]|uniref:Acyltransferase n=1 Tax=Microvirga aerophila TaxID=670291 RepID=A0A512BM96_9HYPH|nr:acyltransferase family protein [Microvirga aerophila]GEO13079.1 acyltransferase [Microvirga aerophila]